MPSDPSLAQRPRWLDEEPTLQDLLSRFLDKVENTQRLSLRVSNKTLPELFDANANSGDYLWALIKELDKEYHILTIKLGNTKPHQQPYDNAQIFFIPEKEELVRSWLNRPRLDPYALLWDNYLQKYAHHFEDKGEALAETIIRVSHKSPQHILNAFVQVGRELRAPITLRALSARCFWGDSKFLDRSENLIHALYPTLSRFLLPRPILLNCYIPESIDRVLFVENQDSFLMLTQLKPTHTALIYSAGFRGSATRIREQGNAVFAHLTNNANEESFKIFSNWWFKKTSTTEWPVQFWGDLDFAGCAILKTLRTSFTEISAWQPGYKPLLARLEQGNGHGHNTSGKMHQTDPGETGCNYTDQTLLPAIRDSGIFIDQEAVLGEELPGFR